MGKYGRGNAGCIEGQKVIKGGKGGKMGGFGFGEQQSKVTGSAGMGVQKTKSDKCTVPDGQKVMG